MKNSPYKIGQEVFVVEATPYGDIRVPCPVCFGKLSVTLILGNGEHQDIECEYCRRGHHGPSGTVYERAPHSRVEKKTVSGLNYDAGTKTWKTQINGFTEDITNIFINADMAEAYRARRHAEVEKTAADMNTDRRTTKGRGLSWSAGYALNQIKEAERTIAHQRAKLSATKEKK